MKKMILLITLLLSTITTFGQPYGGLLSYFTERPAFEFRDNSFSWTTKNSVTTYYLTPQRFGIMLKNELFAKKIDEITYSFWVDSKFYMISYDTCNTCLNIEWHDNMKVTRSLYLFRLDDSGWTRACAEPIQVDYKEVRDSGWSYVSYFPWRYCKDFPWEGMVNKLGNGDIFIRMINHTMTNYSDPNSKIKYFYSELILKPDGKGKYVIKEYRPIEPND